MRLLSDAALVILGEPTSYQQKDIIMKRSLKDSCGRTANEIAAEMAAWLRNEHIHVHRGVSDLDDDVVVLGIDGRKYIPDDCLVVFGNDCFLDDARSRREVELLRADLAGQGLEEMGFGLDPDGVTWAMVVLCDDAELLNEMVWDAWFRACGMDVTVSERPSRLGGDR